MSDYTGPIVPFSAELHASKYRVDGESFRDCVTRQAATLQDNEDHFNAYRDALGHMRFLPAGRVQSAIGSTKNITAYNCFVSGTIPDSFAGIMVRATEAAETMRKGGGIGYDFSTLRPRGATIKSLGSQSGGPIAFMDIFDSICRCIASSGHRRGAQMGIIRVDHPDIEEFIHAKQNIDRLTGFNISVAVTDEFMRCLERDEMFPLQFEGEVYREVRATELWNMVMRATWDYAEPGVIFIDTVNNRNNLYYCESIAATNPCGEQPLPPFGACLLGSFNLVSYLKSQSGVYRFDEEMLKNDIPHVVRAMDNVIESSNYPLIDHEYEAKSKRRMGLGVTGTANCIEALGHRYGSIGFIQRMRGIMNTLKVEAYRASIELAKEKGPADVVSTVAQRQQYVDSHFVSQLPTDIRDGITKYGIRNSHLLSIAPTGTISLCADNVSSGIEPVFATYFDRTVVEFEGPRVETVEDYGWSFLEVTPKTASEVTAQEHLSVLIEASRHVDSAVSKTCNIGDKVPWDEFKELYVDAWRGGAKGVTTFRAAGKRKGVLVAKEEPTEPQACVYNAETGQRSCDQ